VILLKCALTLRNEESVLKGLLLKKTLLFFVSPSEKKKSCLLFLLVIIIIIVETLCSRCCALGALKRLLLRARAVAAEAFLFNTNSTTTTKERERTTRERILRGNEEDALAPKIPFAAKNNFNGFQVRRYKRANRKVSVVLQERTKHLGKKSEVVSVKPGRARNHLIPQKLAKYATEENVEKALREKEERDVSEEEEEEHLDEDEEKKVRLLYHLVF
jgi:hypothetical protein